MEREHEVGEADKGEEKVQQQGESEEGEKQAEETKSVLEPEKKKKAPPAKSGKVEVRLQAAGDAPIMKQKNYKVSWESHPRHISLFPPHILNSKNTLRC